MVVARIFLISGWVQGVGYRFFTEREANHLRVRGYVRNLSDGKVEVYAMGEERTLQDFKRRLSEGPSGARVSGIKEKEAEIDAEYSRFVIEASC
ncbi:MAG: acylphosphatase [Terriglobia bacterium]